MILAVDPGHTTGLAIYVKRQHDTFEVHGRVNAYMYLERMISTMDPGTDTVVCESYRITVQTARLSQQFDALYLIGVIEFLCLTHNIPLVMQAPSSKSFASDNKLEHLGWYHPSAGGHRNDASRHLLYYLVTEERDALILQKLESL
jgi:hypothetical protein